MLLPGSKTPNATPSRPATQKNSITAPAIYNYFPDRDALVTALISDAYASFGDRQLDAMNPPGLLTIAAPAWTNNTAYDYATIGTIVDQINIMSYDLASETAALATAKIKQNAAMAMLAQANQQPAFVLALLR